MVLQGRTDPEITRASTRATPSDFPKRSGEDVLSRLSDNAGWVMPSCCRRATSGPFSVSVTSNLREKARSAPTSQAPFRARVGR